MNRHRALAAFRSSEAGFAIMETVVSAAVLAIVAFAVLAGIDGASSSTGREKARSIAASLAEQDQERMRSMQADSLAEYAPPAQQLDVDGSTYTIESEGRWITDADGGTTSCANNSKQADYIQITSRVTSQTVGVRTAPVEIRSIVAPSVAYSSTRGSLAVLVKNRDDVGVESVAVTISGPTSAVEDTNAEGCAVFHYLPEGNYTITLNRPQWVDKFGNQDARGNQNVRAGTLNLRTMSYDLEATIEADVETYWPGSTEANHESRKLLSTAQKLTITNAGEASLRRVFAHGTPGTWFSSLRLEHLFPFTSEYNVFTGGCSDSNPVNYVGNFFSRWGAENTDRGGTHDVDPTVRQPPFNIRIRNHSSTTTYINGATVRATLQSSDGCEEDPVFLTTMNPTPATPANLGWVAKPAPLTDPLRFDPGMPFGTYDLCIEYQSQLVPARWRRYETTYVNGGDLNPDPPIEHPFGRPTTQVFPPIGAGAVYQSQTTTRRCD